MVAAIIEPPAVKSGDEPGDGHNDVALPNDNNNTMISTKEEQTLPPDNPETKTKSSLLAKCIALYWEHEFLLWIIGSIGLARAYPPLGAKYLYPDITATYIAVILIFLLAGLSLQTKEFKKALSNWKFNLLIQIYNFGVVSLIVFGVSRALSSTDIISTNLADGMVICASLPMTISMVNVLTKASNGDEAAAIFNSAIGNFIGVFLSPILILLYLGVDGNINIEEVLVKLIIRVVIPVIVGQVLQQIPTIQTFMKKYKNIFKMMQQYLLIFIVYTVFCRTFTNDEDDKHKSSIGDIFLMILFQFLLLSAVMILAWYMLKFFYRNEPELQVMGLFGCSHKTVAIGVPLINAIYEDNPAVGLYTLPLLIWHPLQLIVGTMLSPHLAAYVTREQEARLSECTAADPSVVVQEEGPRMIATANSNSDNAEADNHHDIAGAEEGQAGGVNNERQREFCTQ